MGNKKLSPKNFLKGLDHIIYKKFDQKMNFSFDPDEIEIRLPFYRFIFGGLCTQVFYSSAWLKK